MITKIIMDGGTSNHDFKLHTFYSPDSFFILARHDFLNVTNTKLTGIQSGGVKDFLRNLNTFWKRMQRISCERDAPMSHPKTKSCDL